MPRLLHTPAYEKLRVLLLDARVAAGLTQEDVAQRLQRQQSFVSKYESGERYLDVIEFIEICAAVQASPVQIIEALAPSP